MITHVETPQSRCLFGLARCDVTPPVGTYHRMWGAATHDRSTGVHRPLTATALVFRPLDGGGGEEQMLIALDHCLLWAREMNALLDAICTANKIPQERVVVTFSHTHAAGLMDLGRVDLPGGDLIPQYLKELGTKLAHIVAVAREHVQPVTITYGSGRCGLATHRDYYDEHSRQWVCGFNPGGEADDTVLVARVTDEADQLVATVVNYACHPTTLAWENTQISPDYVGALREVVEEESGALCVFLQGASGEIGPREGFTGDLAIADRNGRQLAHAALSAFDALPPAGTRFEYAGPVISGATLGTWKHRPLGRDSASHAKRFRVRRWTVDLPYPADRPSVEQLHADREKWEAAERAARTAGEDVKARDSRAMIERVNRALTRRRDLPEGETFPYPVTLWQTGDALWLTVEGEPYQLLQTALRKRFPETPIVVSVLANGTRCSYLPTRETYGKGIYQETIAVLAPGCLETLVEAIAAKIDEWV